MGSRVRATTGLLARAVAGAAAGLVLVGGAGCSGAEPSDAREQERRPPAEIPKPNTRTPKPGPSLPRSPGLPPDTASLDEMRKQGKTDVFR